MHADRWIDLDGAVNARDLGGLPLRGGGVTRAGVLLRSDNLQSLSAEDVERLVGDLGVRRILDLRTTHEVDTEGPGPLAGDGRVDVVHRSLHPETGERTDVVQAGATSRVAAYLRYLDDRPDSVAGAVADVATAPGATVVHCAAGMDRTGLVCALALDAAGVERAAIVADYLATGERMGQIMARLLASPTYAPDLEGRDWTQDFPQAETIEQLLAVLDDRHGGAAGWLHDAGLSEAELTRLRARLAPGPWRPDP